MAITARLQHLSDLGKVCDGLWDTILQLVLDGSGPKQSEPLLYLVVYLCDSSAGECVQVIASAGEEGRLFNWYVNTSTLTT